MSTNSASYTKTVTPSETFLCWPKSAARPTRRWKCTERSLGNSVSALSAKGSTIAINAVLSSAVMPHLRHSTQPIQFFPPSHHLNTSTYWVARPAPRKLSKSEKIKTQQWLIIRAKNPGKRSSSKLCKKKSLQILVLEKIRRWSWRLQDCRATKAPPHATMQCATNCNRCSLALNHSAQRKKRGYPTQTALSKTISQT